MGTAYTYGLLLYLLYLVFGFYIQLLKLQLIKEQKKFEAKFESLDIEKVEKAKKQETFKEILATSSVSKI